MKLITRNTDYAVRALLYIARSEKELVTARDLVRDLKIPRPFLRKILQVLNKRRLLTSYKGRGGGFKLAKKADDIYLIELIRIFQGRLQLNKCLFRKRLCPNVRKCRLKKIIDNIERRVTADLEKVTLGKLIN